MFPITNLRVANAQGAKYLVFETDELVPGKTPVTGSKLAAWEPLLPGVDEAAAIATMTPLLGGYRVEKSAPAANGRIYGNLVAAA